MRRRAFGMVTLAGIHLQGADLEAACAAGEEAIALAARLKSGRSRENLRDLYRRLEPYRADPAAQDLGARLEAALFPHAPHPPPRREGV